jgi:uncharacterized protein Yka (UPF0111/DUF47 family)
VSVWQKRTCLNWNGFCLPISNIRKILSDIHSTWDLADSMTEEATALNITKLYVINPASLLKILIEMSKRNKWFCKLLPKLIQQMSNFQHSSSSINDL